MLCKAVVISDSNVDSRSTQHFRLSISPSYRSPRPIRNYSGRQILEV